MWWTLRLLLIALVVLLLLAVGPWLLPPARLPSALEAAGLPRVRFHDARHTAASMLLLGGASPVQVQHLLGHSSITFTLGTYSHLLPELAQDTAARMDRMLGTASGT